MELQLTQPMCCERVDGAECPYRQGGASPLASAFEALRRMLRAIPQQEVTRHASRFESADRADLDRLTDALVQRVLAVPAGRLTEACPARPGLEQDAALLARLFTPTGRDDAASGRVPDRPSIQRLPST